MSVVVERQRARWACPLWGALLAAIVLVACEGEKAAVLAEPQTTAFAPVATPSAGQSTIVLAATANSGLPVHFRSLTPSVCTVDAGGLVTGLSSGICTIAADQSGDARFAPAPRVTLDIDFTLTAETLAFTRVPALAVPTQSNTWSPSKSHSKVRAPEASVSPERSTVSGAVPLAGDAEARTVKGVWGCRTSIGTTWVSDSPLSSVTRNLA